MFFGKTTPKLGKIVQNFLLVYIPQFAHFIYFDIAFFIVFDLCFRLEIAC